jgi:NAD(P)H-quinone oxidoreductase subunit I
MAFPMIPRLLTQLFKKPATNPFPAKYLPPTITGFLADVAAGKAKLNPPVPVPKRFKGKLVYKREKCTGCGMCAKVCPALVIEIHKEEKYITVFQGGCIQCEQCVDACPFKCLSMSEEFLTANTDRYQKNMIMEDD